MRGTSDARFICRHPVRPVSALRQRMLEDMAMARPAIRYGAVLRESEVAPPSWRRWPWPRCGASTRCSRSSGRSTVSHPPNAWRCASNSACRASLNSRTGCAPSAPNSRVTMMWRRHTPVPLSRMLTAYTLIRRSRQEHRHRSSHTGYQHDREHDGEHQADLSEREALAQRRHGSALDRGRHDRGRQRLPQTEGS